MSKNIDRYGYPSIARSNEILNPDLTKKGEATVVSTSNKSSSFTSWNIALYIFILLYLLLVYIAGYHAYSENMNDKLTLKWARIIVAVIFMPAYITYILLKSFFIEFISSNANSFDFSYIDYLFNIAFNR
jgi:hypothetical protein